MIIICDTMKLFLKGVAAVFLVLLFALSLKGAAVYHYIALFFTALLLNGQIIRKSLEKQELKLLRQFDRYLSDMRHYYHRCGMIDEAVYDSMVGADYEISLHIEQIYELLKGPDCEAAEYKDSAPDKFLITFYALCRITMQYGDSIRDNQSQFLSNLTNLKNEVNLEILKREKVKHVFQGLLFLTVFPVFFIKPVEIWGISNLPELRLYYKGSYGIIAQVIIFLVTMVIYEIICKLKDHGRFYRSGHPWLERIAKIRVINRWIQKLLFAHAKKTCRLDRLLKKSAEEMTIPQFIILRIAAAATVILIVLVVGLHTVIVSRNNIIHYTGNYKGTSLVNREAELKEYRLIVEQLADRYKYSADQDIRMPGNILEREIKAQYSLIGEYDRKALEEEIQNRIMQYRRIRIPWYLIPAAVLLGGLASYLPVLSLILKGHFMKRNMEDEIMQFHTIILMLKHIGRMNVATILEWLENFAELFKPAIMECLDQYYYDEEDAFLSIKEKEPFLPFVRIIEDLEACDRVGIEQAFDGLEGQMEYLLEKRRQDNEISISDRGVLGRIMAYIPMILTMGGYLILPFIMESMHQLMGYMEQLKVN